MKEYFVMLGGNPLGKGALDKLHEFGYDVIVVDWNENPSLTGEHHIRLDVKDSVAVVNALAQTGYVVKGAMSFIDLAVPTVNAVNKWCGNVHMPAVFNEVITKEQMRKCWQKAGIFNRISETDDNFTLDQVVEWSKKMKLICKPNVAASSRGITILPLGQSKEIIYAAISRAKDYSFDNKCLMEEFVEGREFTVDMLGDSYGNVSCYGISVKYHSPYAINNRTATKIHWNSNVYPDDVYRKIAERGKNCYRAMGLKSSFGHLEMIMKDDGTLTPVEIGARSSGFISSHLVSAAAECDYLGDYVKMLHGEAIDNVDHICSNMSAMWYGYDMPTNSKLIKEGYLTDYLPKGIETMYSDHHGLVLGRQFGPVIDDNTRDNIGYEMLKGPKELLTLSNVLEAEYKFIANNLNLD